MKQSFKQLKTITLTLSALTLAACASSSVYHPASFAGDEGFSERQITSNQYRVTFRGRSTTPRETVEDYLLLHAAEIALRENRPGFIVTESDTDADVKIQGISRPALYGRASHFGPYYRSFPFYAYGYEWGFPYDYAYRETREYVAVAYITLLDETAISGNPKVFRARDVMDNIGPVSCYRKEHHDETNCPFTHNHE